MLGVLRDALAPCVREVARLDGDAAAYSRKLRAPSWTDRHYFTAEHIIAHSIPYRTKCYAVLCQAMLCHMMSVLRYAGASSTASTSAGSA